ncbi:MAG: hypothetical protein C4576_15660, partial [Desulfobacteraceae bacterium]
MSDESEKELVGVTDLFDEILARHMERLLGSRNGIGGLQLKIGTIACLTLIADQINRGGSEGSQEEENTFEALENRLAELGLQEKVKVESLIQEMVEKGYLLSDDQGNLSGGKPAVSMARLLERVFPKLPGETLVAYFIQTIDEVRSGRKTPELAVAHFDQTLKMQGVPVTQLKGEKATPVQRPTPRVRQEEFPQEIRNPLKRTQETLAAKQEHRTGFRIIGSSEDGYRYSAKSGRTTPSVVSSQAPVPLATDREKASVLSDPTAQNGTREVAVSHDHPSGAAAASKDVSPEAISEEATAILAVQEYPVESRSVDIAAVTPSQEQEPAQGIPEESALDSVMEVPEIAPSAETDHPQIPGEEGSEVLEHGEGSFEIGGASAEPEGGSIGDGQVSQGRQRHEDDLIASQVAGFQDELASQCPLCKDGKIKEEKTGTGRAYFKCSNKSCNLVSWGRPHHISCPVCNNPFLIEVSAG